MMPKGISIIFATVAMIAISGCSSSVPKCGDTETTDLVKDIADREMARQYGTDFASLFSYSVESVRTTWTDEQTGAHECAAQLVMSASNTGQSEEAPITYTVEVTDDGEEFFVNVYGL
ncbi:hypothetical protein [Halomonas sp. NCCP-2165]|nr:hypothetical protein [Halomonas sp. NCCP-2165]GKW50443.1 hypothetical protein NCCP2165_26580 [Halomonas sp. NCCP-2165]